MVGVMLKGKGGCGKVFVILIEIGLDIDVGGLDYFDFSVE